MRDFKFLLKNIDKLLAGLVQQEKGYQKQPELKLSHLFTLSTILHKIVFNERLCSM
jgi:hypothetical protein